MKSDEIEHLRHMETAIIPILVAVSIFAFNLYVKYAEVAGVPIFSLIIYISATPLVLSALHLYFLILKKVPSRLTMFFVDAFMLTAVGFVSILLVIYNGLFDFFPLPLERILFIVVGGIIVFITSSFLIFKKIMPTFEKDIFPTLCRENKIPWFRYKTQRK